MQISRIETTDETTIIVQGFRKNDDLEISPYVYIAEVDQGGNQVNVGDYSLSTENAHILSEEIRKHAEFASAEKGE